MTSQVSTPGRVQLDVTVVDQGSIVILMAETPAGVEWVEEHIGQDNGYQPYWPNVVVGHRYADDVINGMIDDGLAVG